MKKIRQPAVKVGIWLDRDKAFIIRIVGEGEPDMEKIKSGAEIHHVLAGKLQLQARPVNPEKKQPREQHRFLMEIIDHIRDADFIGIFGPGQAKLELNMAMEGDRLLKEKVVTIRAEDKITKSQMMALVKNYFSSESFIAQKERSNSGGK